MITSFLKAYSFFNLIFREDNIGNINNNINNNIVINIDIKYEAFCVDVLVFTCVYSMMFALRLLLTVCFFALIMNLPWFIYILVCFNIDSDFLRLTLEWNLIYNATCLFNAI